MKLRLIISFFSTIYIYTVYVVYIKQYLYMHIFLTRSHTGSRCGND